MESKKHQLARELQSKIHELQSINSARKLEFPDSTMEEQKREEESVDSPTPAKMNVLQVLQRDKQYLDM